MTSGSGRELNRLLAAAAMLSIATLLTTCGPAAPQAETSAVALPGTDRLVVDPVSDLMSLERITIGRVLSPVGHLHSSLRGAGPTSARIVESPVGFVPPQAPAAARARRGLVRLDGRVFVDDEGPFLATGATLFWAVWGWQHDRARLAEHFRRLADLGVDYVRVLGVVGPSGPWADRAADPRAPGYDEAIAGTTDLAYEQGLRVEWTIFGGTDSVPTEADRLAVVDRFMKMAATRGPKIIHWEVANEAWGEGSATPMLPDELRRLAERIQRRVPQAVATTAANLGGDGCGTGTQYGPWATIRTMHLDREKGGAGGEWSYVQQPWKVQFCPPPPRAWTNNEGMGPASSVEQDADPLRLTMYAAATWLAGGAAYVYHSGAGIFGKADPSRERPADLWETRNFDASLRGIVTTRSLLPRDLPNWASHDCNDRSPDRPFDCDGSTVLRMYCATRESDIVCMPLAIDGTLRLVARQPVSGTWHDGLTGAALGSFGAAAGATVTFTGREAAILIARQPGRGKKE